MYKIAVTAVSMFTVGVILAQQPNDHLVFEGGEGPGAGKHIVLLAGDEEYRSEEAMPMLGQLLSKHYGFKCTILFSLNEQGEVDPTAQGSLSHPEALDSADLMILSLRFRSWNDDILSKFDAAIQRGTSIIGLRTSTHAFRIPGNKKWHKYSFNAKKTTGWEKGFGRHVLGEGWVKHHGKHKVEGCRSVIEEANKDNPILNSVGTIFAESDVYTAEPQSDSTILLRGEVTETLEPDSAPVVKKNNPMQPIAWTRLFKNESGKNSKVFTTTMGAASDLDDENLRRLVVNAAFWGLDLQVPSKANVTVPESFKPTFYGFKNGKKGLKPVDFIPKENVEKQLNVPTKMKPLTLKKDGTIAIIGAGLASRMMKYGQFETELQLRYPDLSLTIRNLADEGNTPIYRPHSGVKGDNIYAFKEGKQYLPAEFASGAGNGNLDNPEQWLQRVDPDVILAFFGYNSAMQGAGDLDRYKKEFSAFLDHTLSQKYSGSAAQLAVVSPTAIQDLSKTHHTPDGTKSNKFLALYTEAMRDICKQKNVLFLDVFTPSKAAFDATSNPQTVDGALLTDSGYQWLAPVLADGIFGKVSPDNKNRKLVHDAVMEKNWVWHNLYKVPNGVHVFGRRFKPFGPKNYPDELKKLAEMTRIRDRAIWHALDGKSFDLKAADARTHKLSPVKTNFKMSKKNGSAEYLSGTETIKKLSLPKGYKIELFADEKMFPELANPAQMSFDNKGRLWVGCMPSYPHWRPGDPKPKDSLLILEDTNNDGKADKRTVFADDLHLCIGFEFTKEGVIVSQADSIILLTDTDGDDKYDKKEYLASGFDDHDTHHAISAFCADPSGAIYMGEGVFLRSNVETVYGTHRAVDGGFFRYNPKRRHLEHSAQLAIPNPWGIAFDKWGQNFYLNTSNPNASWMAPGTVKPKFGVKMRVPNILGSDKVRPTSGMEFVSSGHFPDEVQGDLLICNNIGFLGIKQHIMSDNGGGYETKGRHDLLVSEEGNFRPVDLEFAPDGSLYVIDWSNTLIGHMQHNARDPLRDHVHGRIYRITYPSRDLVKPAKIHGASIPQLLENLKLYEDRSRYRTRRELRSRETGEVIPAVKKWVASLKTTDPNYEHQLLEALWVTWGHDAIDQPLLRKLLKSKDLRVRAAAVRAVRYNTHQISDYKDLLMVAAKDTSERVRVEVITAASWMPSDEGLAILAAAKTMDPKPSSWTKDGYRFAEAVLKDKAVDPDKSNIKVPRHLARNKKAKELYTKGYHLYIEGENCSQCHAEDGEGLPAANFPPLNKSRWVTGDPERLIKMVLKGVTGEMVVRGKKYNGAMPGFEGRAKDEEIAAMLTYVRNAWKNKASAISPEQVTKVRKSMKGQADMLNAKELLKKHPH